MRHDIADLQRGLEVSTSTIDQLREREKLVRIEFEEGLRLVSWDPLDLTMAQVDFLQAALGPNASEILGILAKDDDYRMAEATLRERGFVFDDGRVTKSGREALETWITRRAQSGEFADPCKDCAFRPGSTEQTDDARWAEIKKQCLDNGQVFWCHRNLPIALPGPEEKPKAAYDYRTRVAHGSLKPTDAHICEGWRRARRA